MALELYTRGATGKAWQSLIAVVRAGATDISTVLAPVILPLLSVFVGDSGSGGVKGLVPAPSAGDAAAHKFLGAGGSFITVDAVAATLESGSLSGASVDLVEDSSGLWAQYRELILLIDGASSSSASAATAVLHSINSGSSFISSGYFGATINDAGAFGFVTAALVGGRTEASAARAMTFFIRITGHQSGCNVVATWVCADGSVDGNLGMCGYQAGTSAVNALRIQVNAGTFDAGTYKLYGIK